MYQIKIDGKIVYRYGNSIPSTFGNVQVYASDPWHPNVDGKLRNIVIENRGIE